MNFPSIGFSKKLFKNYNYRNSHTLKKILKDIYVVSMQKFWERFVINQEKLPDNATGYICNV